MTHNETQFINAAQARAEADSINFSDRIALLESKVELLLKICETLSGLEDLTTKKIDITNQRIDIIREHIKLPVIPLTNGDTNDQP